jgi:hypothetical protein
MPPNPSVVWGRARLLAHGPSPFALGLAQLSYQLLPRIFQNRSFLCVREFPEVVIIRSGYRGPPSGLQVVCRELAIPITCRAIVEKRNMRVPMWPSASVVNQL